MKHRFPKTLLGLILFAGGLTGTACWSAPAVLLSANFNDKPLNAPIGTGGPSVGEPIFVHPLIDAKVQAAPGPTPSLHIAKPSGSGYSSVVFELPGSVEIRDGDLRVAFSVRAPASLTNFRFAISEQGNSIRNFGRLELTATGAVVASDGGGSAGTLRSYLPNETLHVEYLYRLDSASYDLRINSVLLLNNRPHGVVDPAEGIGRVFVATDQNVEWVVDDLSVVRTSRSLLKADFNDRPLNIQIGEGGPSLGEPVSVDAMLEAKVQTAPLATPSLHLKSLSNPVNTIGLRFEFIDSAEIQSGDVRFGFTVRAPAVLTQLSVGVREQGSSSASFGTVTFATSGSIITTDANSGERLVGTYAPNQTVEVEYFFYTDLGVYDLRINGILVVQLEPHGVTDPTIGIGRVSFGVKAGQEWIVDDIHVTHTTPSRLLLNASFNDKPINTPIATGGPTVGEPISIHPDLITTVVAGPFPTRALAFEQSTGGTEKSARFELLDSREATNGELRTSVRVLPPAVNDTFRITLREQGSTSLKYGSLDFLNDGSVRSYDQAGNVQFATYTPGVAQLFEFFHHVDSGTYDIHVDGVPKLVNRSWGTTPQGRGIGSVVIETVNSPPTALRWVIDELRVYQPGEEIFGNGFD